MLKLSSLLLSLTLLSSCSAMSMLVRRSNQVQVCGRALSETLSLVCSGVGGYYDPSATTTTTEATVEADLVNLVQRDILRGPLFKGTNVYGYLFRSGPSSNRIPVFDYERKTRQQQDQEEGIVDECCRRPCTFKVLSSYCNGK